MEVPPRIKENQGDNNNKRVPGFGRVGGLQQTKLSFTATTGTTTNDSNENGDNHAKNQLKNSEIIHGDTVSTNGTNKETPGPRDPTNPSQEIIDNNSKSLANYADDKSGGNSQNTNHNKRNTTTSDEELIGNTRMSDKSRHHQDDVMPTEEREDLANTQEVGEMKMTQEPTEMETDEQQVPRSGDEATVASSNKSNQSRSNKPKPWQKRVVKLLITNNNKRSDDVIVNEMMKVLSSLQSNLPNNVSIITNTGRPYERGSGTTEEFMKQYKVYQKAKGKARTQHWILTDIQSNFSLK